MNLEPLIFIKIVKVDLSFNNSSDKLSNFINDNNFSKFMIQSCKKT